MYAVGRIGSYITQGVYTVSGPFHPFGGAVDIIVVQQQDGSFKSSPWYVRFGKFQGVLKAKEKVVKISVDGAEASFRMYLDNKGEAYFLKELDAEAEESAAYSSSSPSSSSSDDTDAAQSRDKMRPIKSKSCNYDSGNSPGKSNGEILASPRRSRILGFVFGRRSIKEFVYRDDEIGSADVACSKLLERAEIAADLLELKWSTNLVTSKNGKYNASSFSANAKDLYVKTDIDIETVEASIIVENDEQDVNAKGVISLITSSDSQMELPSELSLDLSDPEVLEVLHQDTVNERAGEDIDLETKDVCNALDQTLSESDCRVITGDQTASSVEEVESDNISTFCRSSDSILQVQKEESMRDEAITSKLPNSLESDEEQFIFTDIDEFKAKEIVQHVESNGLEFVDPLVHEVVNDEPYASIDEPTCPMSIPEIRKAADEDPGRLVASLPNMQSCLGDVAADNVLLHPLSHSLDSSFKPLEGTSLRKDDPSCKSDGDKERKMEQEHLNIEASHVSIANFAVGDPSEATVVVHGNWRFWPFSMRRSKSHRAMETGLDDVKISDTDNASKGEIGMEGDTKIFTGKEEKKMARTNIPTSEQLASLNLKEGRNTVTFTFSTAMLGKQQVDARIYLWKWNSRIVISDVDGTITKSDVLGQFMPLVGVDWSHIGVAHLFSAIKENGYQMLFLSARAISQAYHTRQFLFNLKQDGKALPEGPVVISPDGLFPSLYREVIRRAPHEFKIACLERIRELFPPDCNPFYAGFGNRDTDEISYVKVGIPRGKIFIINPKGEVAVNHRVDKQCYPSLHALVNGMFPPAASFEQEDYNSWNFWKLPLVDI